MRISHYGEFDPFSGSIPQRANILDRARPKPIELERILAFCAQTRHPSTATRELHATIDRILQSGRARPDRSVLLAHLAARQDHLPPHEVARLALAVQTAYFAMGGCIHAARRGRVCHLFPGAFAQILQQNAVQVDSMEPPPYDDRLARKTIDQRLRRIGLDPERVLATGPRALLDVAQSAEWKAILALLSSPSRPLDVEQALEALFRRYPDFRDALGHIETILPCRPARLPISLPAPWQLATQALLGVSLADETKEPQALLDLRTLRMSRGDRSASLRRRRRWRGKLAREAELPVRYQIV